MNIESDRKIDTGQSEYKTFGWIPCALCKAWIPIVKGAAHEPPKHGICPYRKPSKCKTEPSFGCRWGFTA